MITLDQVSADVVGCTRCPRLNTYTADVASKKVRRFMEWNYWGKPVPGFGDPNASLLIIGLAPAAHGANRTGRMFTGDSSGDWLYKALHETGFANQPTSESIDDGLELTNAYITAIGRCAPPDNKPTTEEIANCSSYLEAELDYFSGARAILCLGGLAFNRYCRLNGLKGLKFAHGLEYDHGDTKLMASYHPSRQNTNTGRLKWEDWLAIFQRARELTAPR